MTIVLDQARAALARGDLLTAYDIGRMAGVESESRELVYLSVLAVARMGETEQAIRLYEESGLGDAGDVDSQALRARLLKDRALASQGSRRTRDLQDAGAVYAAIFERTGDPFPAINAATLACLGGKKRRATALARATLSHLSVDQPRDYYGAVTKAEALLILGDSAGASMAVAAALALPGANFGARSTTLRQFEQLSLALGGSKAQAMLDLLRPPKVAMFSGHIFRSDESAERHLAREIDGVLDAKGIGFGYGALAAGSDLLFAERLLARGAELHVVLPFAERDFVARSVKHAGPEWEARYDAVRAAAAGISLATVSGYVDDPSQFGYGASVAMGMARLRARHLRTEAVQIAIWDGRPGAVAGTGHDVAQWRATGGVTHVVTPPTLNRLTPKHGSRKRSLPPRPLKALIFTDFPGFTRIDEARLPAFWSSVMASAGDVLRNHAASVDMQNSWGDAMFAVLKSVESAAAAALDLQDALSLIDPARLGLREQIRMRVSVHYAPVYAERDPITGRDAFYGSEISRAARAEPMTPPGSVYASEPFAAILANEAPDRFSPTYVGKIDLPKGYGRFPLYAIRRRA